MTALPIALVFLFWGDWVLGLVFGAQYVSANGALAILAMGQLTNAALGSVSILLVQSGCDSDSMRGRVVAVGANIALCFASIPLFGLKGAAFASVVSLSLWNVLMYRGVRERLGIDGTVFSRRRTD